MEKIIQMSEREYEKLMERMECLERENIDLEFCLHREWEKYNKFYDAVNRPAIEAAAEARDIEFYDWCAEKAAEYEKMDEAEWCACQARLYNNGIKHYCECHGITKEEAEEDRKWNETRDYIWPNEETEGWTELNPYKTGKSRILNKALDSIDKRERIAILEGNKENERKYRKMWLNWYRSMTNDEIGHDEFLR